MREEISHDVVIVGAAIAGLSCARVLQEHGISFTILEETERPGGRIKTDYENGYQLDHGFQVLQTGYPEISRYLDLVVLNSNGFRQGLRYDTTVNFI